MEDICPLLCSPHWLPRGYQALLVIDWALLESKDPFSESKLQNL